MARIVYALCGEGRGHFSRTLAVSGALRDRGHEVMFCCGGSAREALEAGRDTGRFDVGEILGVPALGQSLRDNRVDLFGDGAPQTWGRFSPNRKSCGGWRGALARSIRRGS